MRIIFEIILCAFTISMLGTIFVVILGLCKCAHIADELIDQGFGHFTGGPTSPHANTTSPSRVPLDAHSQTDRVHGPSVNIKKHSLARWLAFHHALN